MDEGGEIMSDVDTWLSRETKHKRKALENASRHFDDEDSLDVNDMEAVYGVESSFGTDRRSRGGRGAAGDFMLDKTTGGRYGLTMEEKNDERFDVDDSSDAAARYLKDIDERIQDGKVLVPKDGIGFFPVDDSDERALFDYAAYNAGESRIARAQQAAADAGYDPAKWSDVSLFLEDAGMRPAKAEEVRAYVDRVKASRDEFALKSGANKSAKDLNPKKPRRGAKKKGDWVTLPDGRKVFIEKN
jgi:membrane-bound lytic murein transglycosylase MltF